MAHFYAACTLGLEDVLADELQTLRARHVQPRRGGVEFQGDVSLGYLACLWLRSAVRVQEELVRGPARDRDELYRLASSIDWSLFIDAGGTIAVDGAVRDSFANDTRFPVLVVKDAICDQFRHFDGKRPDVDKDRPDLPIKLVLRRDEAILYRDYGGAPLHKRGYREVQPKSPLNEALAAGLVLLSGWDRRSALCDPMCGSATLLIEAAFLAMDRAPGLGRSFAFERWRDTDQQTWQAMYDDAEQCAMQGSERCPPLAGNDAHPGAIAIAKKAIRAAGLVDRVTLHEGNAREFEPPFAPKMVLTNPPYGERLQPDEDSLVASWQALGNFLHQHCGGAMAHVLCGDSALTRHLGLKASRKFAVNNGPIRCRWLRYAIG
ncbi:MAG TPA: RNA methyltransferase [bacterium]|nr:RNA methyltransferase [bacterium]